MTDPAGKKPIRRVMEITADVPAGNPQSYCRLCFSTSSIKKVVLMSTGGDQPLIDSIRQHAGIELIPPEDFPFALCYGCVETLKSIEQFRQRCFFHDQALRQHRLRGPVVVLAGEDRNQAESQIGNGEAASSVPTNDDQTSSSSYGKQLDEYRCYACNKDLYNYRDYHAHMRKVHTKVGGMVCCTMCSKRFRLFTKFQAHMKEHAHDRRRRFFTCKQWKQSAKCCRVCFKKFDQPKELAEHQRTDHGFKFFCEWCLQRFETEKDKLIHKLLMKTSSKDADAKAICAICQQELPNTYALHNHMVKQHEPLYACGSCDDAKFATVVNYVQHQRVDHKFLPEKEECLSCRETFPCWDEYVQHLNTQHTVYSEAMVVNGETSVTTNQGQPTLQIDLDSSEEEQEEEEPEAASNKAEEAMTLSSDDFPIYGNDDDEFNDEFSGTGLETELDIKEEEVVEAAAPTAVSQFDLYGSAFHNLQ